jgi:hypothetical protein
MIGFCLMLRVSSVRFCEHKKTLLKMCSSNSNGKAYFPRKAPGHVDPTVVFSAEISRRVFAITPHITSLVCPFDEVQFYVVYNLFRSPGLSKGSTSIRAEKLNKGSSVGSIDLVHVS